MKRDEFVQACALRGLDWYKEAQKADVQTALSAANPAAVRAILDSRAGAIPDGRWNWYGEGE